MPKLSIPMTDPTSARYIYVDATTNRVHVLLPVVSGDEIGLDNTCKAVYAVQEFFGRSRDAKGISALSSLKSYQEALAFDIGLLKEDSELKEKKISRLGQVNAYINSIVAILLVYGLVLVKQKKFEQHRNVMMDFITTKKYDKTFI